MKRDNGWASKNGYIVKSLRPSSNPSETHRAVSVASPANFDMC